MWQEAWFLMGEMFGVGGARGGRSWTGMDQWPTTGPWTVGEPRMLCLTIGGKSRRRSREARAKKDKPQS